MKKQTYIYSVFERFWHWSQALLIFFLMLTGFEVHSSFELFGFESSVEWHNTAGWAFLVLIIFAIFWHFTTGEWKQYIPTLELVKAQINYYIFGIFKGAPHPTHKTRHTKFNPLQRLIYLGLKLLVIPIQVVTGFIYLSYMHPEHSVGAGNIEFIAILHTIGAFALIAFVIAHVYLTTTGEKVFMSIKAMLTGWEVVDVDEKEEYITNMKQAVEHSTAGYYRLDNEGILTQVNKAWLEIYGFNKKEDVVGNHYSATRDEKQVKVLKSIVDRVLEGEKIIGQHVVRKNKDGSIGQHILSANPIVENGKTVGLEGFILDITDMGKDSQHMYSAIRNSSAGYYRINAKGYFEEVNEAWLKIYKCDDKSNVINQHYSITRNPENAKELDAVVEKVLNGGSIASKLAIRKCKDGTVGKHILSANPVYKKDKIVGMEGFIIDVTLEEEKSI